LGSSHRKKTKYQVKNKKEDIPSSPEQSLGSLLFTEKKKRKKYRVKNKKEDEGVVSAKPVAQSHSEI
jgi:hypothetical protein